MFLFALLLVSFVAAMQLDPTLNYTVTLAGGKVSGCNPLVDMLNNHGCEDNAGVQDLWYVDDHSGNQYYRFVPVSGLNNTFNIITSCQKYISCSQTCGDTTLDLTGGDDGSGRQRWLLTPIANETSTYTLQVTGGRNMSCGSYMATGQQCTDTFVDLWTSDDGSGRQRWVLSPVQAPSGGDSSSTASSPLSTSSSLPTPSSSSSNLSSPKADAGKIAGGVIGLTVFLLLLACIVFKFFVSKRHKRHTDKNNELPLEKPLPDTPQNDADTETFALSKSLPYIPTQSYADRETFDGLPLQRPLPYIPTQTIEIDAESFMAQTPITPFETSFRTSPKSNFCWSIEKSKRRRGDADVDADVVPVTTAAPGGLLVNSQRPSRDDPDEASRRMSRATMTTAPCSPSEAADLRSEFEVLRREMAEIRAQREYDMPPPPLYGQT